MNNIQNSFLHDAKGTFSIKIEALFESAHYLYNYYPDGSDEPMHGHSWKVILHLSRKGGGKGDDGISYDFIPAGDKLKEMTQKLDHTVINHIEDFKGINPTAENIALWLYAGLRKPVIETGGIIKKITVFEGPSNSAEFVPENAD
jgi:6-pyruvoyltetrahydropterin/6-carboxytetrahydropterin synthase